VTSYAKKVQQTYAQLFLACAAAIVVLVIGDVQRAWQAVHAVHDARSIVCAAWFALSLYSFSIFAILVPVSVLWAFWGPSSLDKYVAHGRAVVVDLITWRSHTAAWVPQVWAQSAGIALGLSLSYLSVRESQQRFHDVSRIALLATVLMLTAARLGRLLTYVVSRVLQRREQDLPRCLTHPRPLLLWTHFIDAHEPYAAPPEHQIFGREAKDLYHAELHYIDAELERLLQAIEQRRQKKPALVVVLADHGEAFLEHGKRSHGYAVYAEEVRVPL
jgi:hypothetical protein